MAAIHNPDLTLGSGIILRSIVFVALYLVGTVMVARYGAMVKKDGAKSVVAGVEGLKTGADTQKEMPQMTPRRLGSVIVFILVVVFLLIGYIPWGNIGGEAVAAAVNAPLTLLDKVPVLGISRGIAIIMGSSTQGMSVTFVYWISSAVTLGTLDLYRVPYDRYLRFMLKIMIPLLLLGTLIISVASYIGLAI